MLESSQPAGTRLTDRLALSDTRPRVSAMVQRMPVVVSVTAVHASNDASGYTSHRAAIPVCGQAGGVIQEVPVRTMVVHYPCTLSSRNKSAQALKLFIPVDDPRGAGEK